MRRPQVDGLLFGSEQVNEQGTQAAGVDRLGHEPIPRAVAATAASMREEYDPARANRHGEIAVEADAAHRDVHCLKL